MIFAQQFSRTAVAGRASVPIFGRNGKGDNRRHRRGRAAGPVGRQRLQPAGPSGPGGSGAVGRGRERLSAARRPGPQSRRDRQGRGQLREVDADRGHRGARARRPGLAAGDREDRRRSGGVPALPAGAGRAVVGAVAAAGRQRALSRAQGDGGVSRSAGAARGDGEPHRGRAHALQRGGAGVQLGARQLPHRDRRRACSASASPRRRTSRRRRAPPPRLKSSSDDRRPNRRASRRCLFAGARPLALVASMPARAGGDADPAGPRPAGSPMARAFSRRRQRRSSTRASTTTRAAPVTRCWSTSITRPAACRSRTGACARSSAGASAAAASTTASCCWSSPTTTACASRSGMAWKIACPTRSPSGSSTSVMVPRIRAGDRDGAIRAGVDAVTAAIGGVAGARPGLVEQPAPTPIPLWMKIVGGAFLLIFIALRGHPSVAGVADVAEHRIRTRWRRRLAAVSVAEGAAASPAAAAVPAAAAPRGRGDACTGSTSPRSSARSSRPSARPPARSGSRCRASISGATCAAPPSAPSRACAWTARASTTPC